MRIGKLVGPDDLPIEVRKFVGRKGIVELTKVLNNILKTKRMSDEWEKIVYSLYIRIKEISRLHKLSWY